MPEARGGRQVGVLAGVGRRGGVPLPMAPLADDPRAWTDWAAREDVTDLQRAGLLDPAALNPRPGSVLPRLRMADLRLTRSGVLVHRLLVLDLLHDDAVTTALAGLGLPRSCPRRVGGRRPSCSRPDSPPARSRRRVDAAEGARMRHRDVSTAGDAVERLLPHLTPSAVLMADGAGSAVVLLCRALSAPRALDSPHDARQALARDAVGRHRWAAEQVIESLPPAAHPGDDPGLADALRALPDRERAAVVLELVAGVPSAGAAAAVARLRADLVRRDEEFRRERAQAGLLFRRPGSAPDIPEPSPDLRDRLARLAAERPLPDGATGTVVAAVASARRARRRRRLGVVAGVLAAAVVIAVAPRLPDGPGRPDTASVYAGPTRGSLAGDARFLESVRDSGWAQAERETGVRRVVF